MTQEERRKREIEQRRETAINVANRLFYLHGYENVTMDDIASKAELSKTTLYSYFNDKEALFFAVVNQGIRILRALIRENEERMRAAGVKTGIISTTIRQFILEYPCYARAFLYFRSGRFQPSKEKSLNADEKEILEFTNECFEMEIFEAKTGIESGLFRSDVNPVVVAMLKILIHDSISTMSPDLREMLKVYGISMQQFCLEISNLEKRMVMNTEKRLEELNIGSVHLYSASILIVTNMLLFMCFNITL
jgi:TetR/AcrR family transcriptional regulator